MQVDSVRVQSTCREGHTQITRLEYKRLVTGVACIFTAYTLLIFLISEMDFIKDKLHVAYHVCMYAAFII